MNGFINPDRVWQPEAYAVKGNYQDIKFTQTATQQENQQVLMKNFNRFKNTNYYDIVWTLLEDGQPLQSATLSDAEASLAPATGNIGSTDAGARAEKVLTIPYVIDEPKDGAEYMLLMDYKLKEDTVYAPAGYVQGSGQFMLPADIKGTDKVIGINNLPLITTNNTATDVTVKGTTPEGKDFTVALDKTTGKLTE
jgi:beta-galactosidase